MSTISAQVSLYPLRQSDLKPAIDAAREAFRTHGLDAVSGTMSTVVAGEADTVFDALKSSFQSAAGIGDVVMVVSVSNCCPLPAAEQDND